MNNNRYDANIKGVTVTVPPLILDKYGQKIVSGSSKTLLFAINSIRERRKNLSFAINSICERRKNLFMRTRRPRSQGSQRVFRTSFFYSFVISTGKDKSLNYQSLLYCS